MEILTYPDTFLKTPAKQVTDIDGALQELIDDMAGTMYAAPGIGLAAVQVGIDKSLVVYDISPREEGRCLDVLINPKIISAEGTTVSEDEGCLSVPDFRSDVKRHARVQVEAVDRHGNPLRFEAEGLLAIMLQHEIDHLNGILFIDRISKLKRELYTRRIKKQLKQE
ncbi:MAG: peptide deformylase [Desulfobacterales bacterium]